MAKPARPNATLEAAVAELKALQASSRDPQLVKAALAMTEGQLPAADVNCRAHQAAPGLVASVAVHRAIDGVPCRHLGIRKGGADVAGVVRDRADSGIEARRSNARDRPWCAAAAAMLGSRSIHGTIS